MNWEKIPCQHCGMTFENLHDRDEHERCYVAAEIERDTARGLWNKPTAKDDDL